MKAIGYQESLPITDSKVLMDIEQEKPVAKGKDILVKVEAISVNPVDTKVRVRAQPPEGEYKVLGWDAAGIVESVGDDVSLFKVGDKVWYAGALDRQGCNSEFHLVDERIVSKMPNSISFAQAAAMPLTTITAWEVLFDRLKLSADSSGSILIIGGAGGVGSIMIQLAKQLTDLTVIATASRPETQEWAASLGADHVINHHDNMVAEIQKLGIENV
jgi:zinc-binding alcohol dehydrogenase family protein